MNIEISRGQAKIMLQLLEWNIENLIDEPEESPRGIECAECQKLFNSLYEAFGPETATQ
jgi:hypothetical protein